MAESHGEKTRAGGKKTKKGESRGKRDGSGKSRRLLMIVMVENLFFVFDGAIKRLHGAEVSTVETFPNTMYQDEFPP